MADSSSGGGGGANASVASSSSFSVGGSSGGAFGPVRFKTEFEKAVLISNFEKRSFKRTESDRDWNFFWAQVGTVRALFGSAGVDGAGTRLADNQMINHFPSHSELTRKDLMAKHLKRYRRELDHAGSELAQRTAHGAYKHLDFFPQTFTMPSDASVLLEEFKRAPNAVWIMKPNGKSQGKGVFIVHKLAQLKKWLASPKFAQMTTRDSYVVSRYIDRPLLIGGKKFDLRLYCLVTSYRPLKAYAYTEGFARYCNVKYSSDVQDLDNEYMHLTNVAIQKGGAEYNEKHGNKWSVQNLRLYLEATRGHARTQAMFEGIQFIMIHSLKSVKDVMHNDKHCFEMYGYDLLIDEDLKPWLLEINASPSLSITTKPDRILKTKLINDLLEIVVPPDFPDTKTSKGSTSWNNALAVGGFDLLYSEELLAADGQLPTTADGKQKAGGNVGAMRGFGAAGTFGAGSTPNSSSASSGPMSAMASSIIADSSSSGAARPAGKWR